MQKESTTLKELTRRLRKLDESRWTASREQESEIDGVSTVYSTQLGNLQVMVSKSPIIFEFSNYRLTITDTNDNISTNFESFLAPYSRVRSLFYAVDSACHKYQRETRRQAEQANRTEMIGRLETALSNS
ncbi:hypothetical protein HYT23_01820 [Candidatus Pacearchaeota archaeon]|nr:hypothetical protein [Candidatus Pacearchaeota archaeon]